MSEDMVGFSDEKDRPKSLLREGEDERLSRKGDGE